MTMNNLSASPFSSQFGHKFEVTYNRKPLTQDQLNEIKDFAMISSLFNQHQDSDTNEKFYEAEEGGKPELSYRSLIEQGKSYILTGIRKTIDGSSIAVDDKANLGLLARFNQALQEYAEGATFTQKDNINYYLSEVEIERGAPREDKPNRRNFKR